MSSVTAMFPASCIEVAPEPAILVIFGGTGDLATRKLFPSLLQLFQQGLLHEATRIVGCGRAPLSDSEFQQRAGSMLPDIAPDTLDRFLALLTYVQCDAAHPATFASLTAQLKRLDESIPAPVPHNHLFYLALPPAVYQPTIAAIAGAGLLTETPGGARHYLLLEKPFGHDTRSAAELDSFFKTVATEDQLFRIDHYLGKETVQNIMVLRFANIIFESIWNNQVIDHVQITGCEQIGIGNRAAYFESAGIVRDMFQNHLIEMLALVAMEPPESFHATAIHKRKLEVLRAIRPLSQEDMQHYTVRGQYVGGNNMLGYTSEPGVAPHSTTETFAAMRLWVDNPRWQGVPFYLRAGKRLQSDTSSIAIVFKPSPWLHPGFDTPGALVLCSKPREGMRLQLMAKHPGPKLCFDQLPLAFDYATLTRNTPAPDAYARLLLDAMLHDRTLFVHADTIAAAWELFTPLLEQWQQTPATLPLEHYLAGSIGPTKATQLLLRDNRSWLQL